MEPLGRQKRPRRMPWKDVVRLKNPFRRKIQELQELFLQVKHLAYESRNLVEVHTLGPVL